MAPQKVPPGIVGKVRDIDYAKVMNDFIEKGYAESIPKEELSNRDGKVWHFPHHGASNLEDEIIEFRITIKLFGSVSVSVAIFALKNVSRSI